MRLVGIVAASSEILDHFWKQKEPIEVIIKQWSSRNRFAGSKDRRLIGECVFGVLRNYCNLQKTIGTDNHQQMVILYISAHLNYELGEGFGGEFGVTPLDHNFKLKIAQYSPQSTINLPEYVLGYLERQFGDESLAVAKILDSVPSFDIRVNRKVTDKQTVLDFIRTKIDKGFKESDYLDNCIKIDGNLNVKLKNEAPYLQGYFEIQDEASQITSVLTAVAVMQLNPSDATTTVLDYCAGAGGKSLAIANYLYPDETSYAITGYDVDKARLQDFYPRIYRSRLTSVEVIDNAELLADSYDVVIVDAPCTGSGVWRRKPDNKFRLQESAIAEKQQLQQKIIRDISHKVNKNGLLVYITCSIFKEENQLVVEHFLRNHRNWSVVDMKALHRNCVTIGALESELNDNRFVAVSNSFGLQLSPLDGMDGLFIAILQKTGA